MPNYSWGTNGYGEGPYGGGGDNSFNPVGDLSPEIATIDHVTLGLGRLAKQYQASPKLIAYLTAILTQANDVEACLQSMKYLTDPLLMTGANLDVIGQLVGQTRFIGQLVQLSYFGFGGYYYEVPFGEEGQLNAGSRFYEDGENYLETSAVDDVEFRLLIRARVAKNISKSTPEDILAGLSYLFSTDAVNIDDNGGMTIGVSIGRWFTAIEKVIITTLNLLPRPAGASLSSVVNYNALGYFGFNGQNQALTFEEDGHPNGAVFAEEI